MHNCLGEDVLIFFLPDKMPGSCCHPIFPRTRLQTVNDYNGFTSRSSVGPVDGSHRSTQDYFSTTPRGSVKAGDDGGQDTLLVELQEKAGQLASLQRNCDSFSKLLQVKQQELQQVIAAGGRHNVAREQADEALKAYTSDCGSALQGSPGWPRIVQDGPGHSRVAQDSSGKSRIATVVGYLVCMQWECHPFSMPHPKVQIPYLERRARIRCPYSVGIQMSMSSGVSAAVLLCCCAVVAVWAVLRWRPIPLHRLPTDLSNIGTDVLEDDSFLLGLLPGKTGAEGM